MKLLRHILSHLFLISFLIAVVSVFYYRTLLLPGDVVKKIDEVVTDIYPPALKFASKRDYFWSIKGERIVSFDNLKFFSGDKNDVEKESNETTLISKDTSVVNAPQIKKADEIPQNDDSNKEAENPIGKTNKPLLESNADIVSSEVKEKTESIPVETNNINEAKVVIKDSDTSSERDLLVSARYAFNQGTVKQAEKFYLELIQLDNDNPDIFGELGNVYYSQGKWDEAGQAYYEAAVRLITQGNHNQVVYLQRVIKGLNVEHAEKLAQLMAKK